MPKSADSIADLIADSLADSSADSKIDINVNKPYIFDRIWIRPADFKPDPDLNPVYYITYLLL